MTRQKVAHKSARIHAPARLATLKQHAAEVNAAHWQGENRYTWRDFIASSWAGCLPMINAARYGSATACTRGNTRHGAAFYSEAWPFPVAIDAGEGYGRNRITAYYCDDDGHETIAPAVLTYRARDSKTGKRARVYIPAYCYTDSDGKTCFPFDQYETKEEAQRRAHDIAERTAEIDREWRRLDTEANNAAENVAASVETIQKARADFAKLAADYKASGHLAGAVCELLRDKLRRLRDTVRREAAALPKLRDVATETAEHLKQFETMLERGRA